MLRFATLFVWAALAAIPAYADDLAKSGTYTAHYGWTFDGKAQDLGNGRMVYVGMLPGVLFNDAGRGFLHQARLDCTIVNDSDRGQMRANGSCVATDAEAHTAGLVWSCTGTFPDCVGDFAWTGGTGKYIGIAGGSRFQATFIGMSGAGFSRLSGEWKLH
jgi:hypothetical protein